MNIADFAERYLRTVGAEATIREHLSQLLDFLAAVDIEDRNAEELRELSHVVFAAGATAIRLADNACRAETRL